MPLSYGKDVTKVILFITVYITRLEKINLIDAEGSELFNQV